MDLYEVIGQVEALLKEHGRLSYRAVKYQFQLDDEGLEALKEELIAIKELATDKDGKMLIWTGEGAKQETENRRIGEPEKRGLASSDARPQTLDPRPISYTPPHLTERIRAEQAAMEARGASEGERKTITALFADMAGFTALAQGLDPEDTRAIIDPALHLMMEAASL